MESRKTVQMNLFANQKQSYRIENKLMVTKGGWGGWDELGDWIDIHTLLYIK